MSGNEKLERELEAFLAEENSRAAALYRKLPRQEPDAKLDASVLAMARNAVAPRRPRNRWLPALSAATVVLVVAGVAYRAGPQVWNERAAPTSQPAAIAVDEAKPAATASPAPAAPPPPAREAAPDMSAGSAVNTAKPAFVPAPADSLARRKTVEAARTASPAPAPPGVLGTIAQPQQAEKAMAPSRADRPASAASDRDAEAFPSKDLQKQKAAEVESQRMQAEAMPNREETRVDDAKTESAQSATANAAPPVAASSAMKLAGKQLYPEHWISNIRTMLHENRRDEALRDLAEFRKQYPDYKLPDDLRDLK